MDPSYFVIAGIVFFVLGVFWLLHHLEEKRIAAVSEAASKLGLKRSSHLPPEVSSDLQGVELFQRGRNRRNRIVLSGVFQGVPTTLFEYRYETGYGKNRRTYEILCCAFRGDRPLPRFDLRPEGWLDALTGLFGAKDIDFPRDPEFSKRYHLAGPEEAEVRALFTPALLQQLLQEGERVHVAGVGVSVVLFRQRYRLRGETLPQLLGDLLTTARLFLRSDGRFGAR